jgi:hypothetical protein
MIKTRVIKAQTVTDATKIYGEEAVSKIFEMIQKEIPSKLIDKLDDQNLRACLLYLFSGNLD